MRKIIYLFLIISLLIGIINVQADNNVTLKENVIKNVFYTKRGGGKPYQSLPYKEFSINDKAVYCIEPGIEIITHSYISYNKMNESPFDDETNKLIELIGYYGYDYPSHQTQKYRMAAQALIWETTGGQIVEFWTENYGYGDYIDVSKEKNAIMKLVSGHIDLPNFNNQEIKLVLGEEVKLIDANKVLEKFLIIQNNNIDANIIDNVLYVKSIKTGKINLQLKKERYDDERSIIFIGSNPKSQKMAFFRYSEDVVLNLTINVIGGQVRLNKLDYNTKNSTPIVNGVSLSNARYGIYNENNDLLSEIITNEVGYAESKDELAIGKYYLKEISPGQGYLLDDNRYPFEINKDNLVVDLIVYEKIINRDILIKKFIQNKNNNELEKEENIKFIIYNKDEKVVKEIITDKNGIASTNLFLGTYKVKQINTTNGYEKVDDFFINVNNNSPTIIEYSLVNKPIKVKIKVLKKDKDTKKNILSNKTTFKIKNTDLNMYVCYSDLNNKSICEYQTNKNGELITTNEFVYGNYQLEEIKAPDGYLLINKPYSFSINEKREIVNIEDDKYLLLNVYNERIKGSIKINKQGEVFKVENNSFSFYVSNLEGVTYSLYAKNDIISLDGEVHYKKDELIKTSPTNQNGIVIFANLYLGNYYIKETKTLDGYQIDNNIYDVSINEVDYNKEFVFENKLIKGNLKIIKKDIDNNKVIPNTLIAVYNLNDECILINETDNNGIIYINKLPLGKYYIKELESAKGYVKNDEIVNFEINDKNEIKEIALYNKKDGIIVPNTGVNNSFIIRVIIIILINTGIICLYFAYKLNE